MPNIELNRTIRMYVAEDYDFTEPREVSNIVAGTMKIEEMLTDKDLKFGSLFASKMEVQLYDTEDLANLWVKVIVTENGVDKPMFFGNIDSCTRDYSNTYRDIIAYDPSYYFSNIDCAWAYNLFWLAKKERGENRCTIRELRYLIINTYHIPYHFDPTADDNFIVEYSVPITSISVTNMLQMLFSMSCLFLHFNREGRLEVVYINITDTPTSGDINIDGLYEKENSTFEESTIAHYTNVQLYDTLGNLKYDTDTTPGSANKHNNPYTISDNLLIQKAEEADLQRYAEYLMNMITYVDYTPASADLIVSNLDVKVGAKVFCSEGDFYVFQNEYSGPLLVNQTISAEGRLQVSDTKVETSFETAVLEQGAGGGGGGNGFIDIMNNIILAGIITVGTFQATLGVSKVVAQRIMEATNSTYNQTYVELTNDVASMITNYAYEGETFNIDEGYCKQIEIDTTVFQSINSIEVS